jgi:hypothetical protein
MAVAKSSKFMYCQSQITQHPCQKLLHLQRSKKNHLMIVTIYDASNIKLIIWLYNFKNGMRRNLLQAELLVKMDAAYEKDEASVTKSGKKSKTRNYLRNTCREALHSIVVGDNTTCPIKLEEMSFATITQ